MQREVLKELYQQYPDIVAEEDISLSKALLRIHSRVGEQFIFLIDEWDCLFREEKDNAEIQEKYINFLRGIFKGVLMRFGESSLGTTGPGRRLMNP